MQKAQADIQEQRHILTAALIFPLRNDQENSMPLMLTRRLGSHKQVLQRPVLNLKHPAVDGYLPAAFRASDISNLGSNIGLDELPDRVSRRLLRRVGQEGQRDSGERSKPDVDGSRRREVGDGYDRLGGGCAGVSDERFGGFVAIDGAPTVCVTDDDD